jgi:hypothetical protein
MRERAARRPATRRPNEAEARIELGTGAGGALNAAPAATSSTDAKTPSQLDFVMSISRDPAFPALIR